MKDPGDLDGTDRGHADSGIRLNRQGLSARNPLLTVLGRLMAAEVMHRLAVKVRAAIGWVLAARRHWPVIALAVIEVMIDVPVKMIRPMKPRTRADEYAAGKPLWAVVAIGSAVIGRSLVVPVRADRRLSNAD
jgi:hypothetical protein